ncbi:hypothetical protein BCR35DRAFT_72126 [Leucosporidium creatinivorum]|uniref:Xylanolytic transcriptional activator regulatory domain-containing protein n=1 Tax=Leucosporidium creatinivorum TaxID=106004 RepID=A0A1Y2G6J6_9BASI|nr:hypothetical protein BCR35DRAFT_72126 [Leucosporidium creatinivorum]
MPRSAHPPSRDAHRCTVCQRTYSRKEFALRHLRTKKDAQHEEFRRLNDSAALAAAALPRGAAAPLKESPSASGSTSPNDEAGVQELLSEPTLAPALLPVQSTAASQLVDDLPRAPQPSTSLPPPVNAMQAAQPSPIDTLPLFDPLPSLPAPFAELSLPSLDHPLPIPPPVVPSAASTEGAPPLEWGGIDVLDGLLYDPLLDPVASATPFSADWEGSVAAESPSNLAVLVLPGTPREWEEAEDEGEEGEQNRTADLSVVAASDPGYWVEPSFYPDHLFKPQTGHGSTFFYSAQTFCIAWLYPWDVPPLPILSKHASRAATFILPSVPIVHRPTLLIEAVDPSLAFALAVTGAAFSARGSSFSDRMTKTKREFGASHLKDTTLGEEQAFGILQSLVLYNIVGSFHSSHEQREFSRLYHPGLMQFFRSLNVVEQLRDVRSQPMKEELAGLGDHELDQRWRSWALLETKRRVSFLCYLLDLHMVATYQTDPLLPTSYMTLDLPAPDSLWCAETASEWKSAIQRSPSSSLPFCNTLNNLLSTSSEPVSARSTLGRLLHSLPSQSAFTLSILTNSLLHLKNRIQSSQRLLEGLYGSSTSDLDAVLGMQEQVAVARKRGEEGVGVLERALRVVSLAGGEGTGRWFRGVQVLFK